MSVGSPFHPRTALLNRKQQWREWSGYWASSTYADAHDIEYNAIWVVLGWLTGPVAMAAFVASFGLGLADASGTIEPAVHTQQPAPA
jgi:hypothetical protein